MAGKNLKRDSFGQLLFYCYGLSIKWAVFHL